MHNSDLILPFTYSLIPVLIDWIKLRPHSPLEQHINCDQTADLSSSIKGKLICLCVCFIAILVAPCCFPGG